MFAPLTPKTYPTSQSRSAPTKASTSFISDVPDRRRRVIACVREPAERHPRPLAEPPVLVRSLDVDGDGGAEEVSVLLERLHLLLFRHHQRFAPIAEKERIGLIGNQEIEVLRRDLGVLARF